ncbi:MAG: type II toxin-antitoxin system RelE/ParE family toxin [Candidatus Sulfotelmatobacter sp.]
MRSDAVDLHDEASAEYDAAFDWYLERSPDAARRFDAEVERALAQIVQAPRRWAIGPHSTRRFLLRQFPFTLIYRERPSGVIQIVAVAHTSRKPGYWRRRLSGDGP